MRPTFRIILAEDHGRFRAEIKKIINKIPDVEVVGEAESGHELMQFLETSQPHLVLLDISLPNFLAMKATREIKARYPEVKVIIMLMDKENEYLTQAIAAGADGILLKENSAGDLETAIKTVRRGQRYFPRMLEDVNCGGATVKSTIFCRHTFPSFC